MSESMVKDGKEGRGRSGTQQVPRSSHTGQNTQSYPPSLPPTLPPSLPPALPPNLHPRIALNDDVFRFNIAMQQTLRMDKSQSLQNLARNGAEAREGEVGGLLRMAGPALEFVEVVFK